MNGKNIRNGWIFLGGGGDIDQTEALDKDFFSHLKEKAHILYIQAAMASDPQTLTSCSEWFSRLIEFQASDKNILFTMISDKDTSVSIEDYDAIYIGGGNTYKLLDFIKRNSLDIRLIKYISQGGIVYGGSAGAIILGADIRTVSEENDSDYPNNKGLNLLDGLSLRCHYTDSDDSLLKSLPEILNHPVLAITEESGIQIHGDQISITGKAVCFGRK
ncbi:MAG: Type 1 glutamine amidotransferase-like domain-containing protein [Candidatus Gracilibacteria bacterium]|nr:Type 1 glutamine amidotransferase-like domain-containing protein [Candidatus Gracilibacteria bacterium]